MRAAKRGRVIRHGLGATNATSCVCLTDFGVVFRNHRGLYQPATLVSRLTIRAASPSFGDYSTVRATTSAPAPLSGTQ